MDNDPQHDAHPSTYPTNGAAHAQYTPSQYAYAPAATSYPIDSALVMPQHYDGTDGSNIDARLHSDASLASTNGHAPQRPLHALSMHQPMSAHASHVQPLTPTGTKRKSTEDELDGSTGDPKRKRSKVSRACDQCRRKKIRCDADTENGVLKTCSNCTKAGQLCEYSRIPQKRGPSKGYIKELSERVQQVEGQLALQNSATYRSSVDGPPASAYPDQFSPDDESNSDFRRQSSFSQQRNPFADFSRDRFPSVGGWNNASVTSHPTARERDRGSVAIPPDQQPSSAASQSLAAPFWHEWVESPPKRRKLSREAEDNMTTPELSMDRLAPYYTHIKPMCDFLPDFEATVSVWRECSAPYKTAFISVLKLLPSPAGAPLTLQDFGVAHHNLESFFDGRRSIRPYEQSHYDTLMLIWVSLLTAIVKESYLHKHSSSISPFFALQTAVETYRSLHATGNEFLTGALEVHHRRALPVAWLLIRLHSFADGRADDCTPSALFDSASKAAASLSRALAYEFSAAHLLLGLLSMNENIHQSSTHYIRHFRNTATILSDNMQAQFGNDVDPLTDKVIRKLLNCVRARIDVHFFPPDISTPAANLAESLHLQSQAEVDKPWQYDPMKYHAYAIATFTLLELRQGTAETDLRDTSIDLHLRNLQSCLQRESGKIGGANPHLQNWASLLNNLIEAKVHQSNGNGNARHDQRSDAVSTVNFGELFKTGYARLMSLWSEQVTFDDGKDRNATSTVDQESATNTHGQDQNGQAADDPGAVAQQAAAAAAEDVR